jgi:hypothetical protein
MKFGRRQHGSKKVPKGSSTQPFTLLSEDEQKNAVMKLAASGLSIDAIAQLTGLGTLEITQMLESP